jgi:hypothetical protein
LLVSGWLNCFPQLKAAYELKERYIDIWSKSTKEEALAEYLRWEASITPELMKAFKPITVAWRTWRPYILNYFDGQQVTNAFTETFNAKIRKAYRNGHGHSFEVLRAKILFSDALQKRVRVAEKKVRKKQRFEDLTVSRMSMFDMLSSTAESEYELGTISRVANMGTDLVALLGAIDGWQSNAKGVTHTKR